MTMTRCYKLEFIFKNINNRYFAHLYHNFSKLQIVMLKYSYSLMQMSFDK